MKRLIDKYLSDWKKSNNRKVLMLRGARQVGKTYAVRKLGAKFDFFLEVNFDLDKDIIYFFNQSIQPQYLIEKLSAYFSVPIKSGKTLLFLDEIQECEEAIKSLRYFQEKMPELHVIAAGSLLEFALSNLPSYGVGRITALFMYPMTFNEFLWATDKENLFNQIENSTFDKSVALPFYKQLIEIYKTFCLIGGMPEVVKTYAENHDLILCRQVISDLIITLKDDFRKYKKRSPIECLNETFDSIVFQTGSKFVFSNVNSQLSYKLLHQSLDLLLMAGLAYKIYHTSASGLPLGAQINKKKFKIILFDIGIHQQITGTDISSYLTADNFNSVNKGNVAELFVGLELIANNRPNINNQLYYWHREKKSSNAEIDYIIQKGNTILPIEVKTGTKGKMQSMHLFLENKKIDYGLRISLENFATYGKIKTMPLFAVSKLLEQGSKH